MASSRGDPVPDVRAERRPVGDDPSVDRRDPELRLDRRAAGEAGSHDGSGQGLVADARAHDARLLGRRPLGREPIGDRDQVPAGMAGPGPGRRPGTVLADRSMASAEFDLPGKHLTLPVAPTTAFPEVGETEDAVVAQVETRLRENRFPPERNFAITYSGTPQAISRRVESLAQGTFFVEWADETESGTLGFEREAIRMMG